jgi:uncharacterized DUF497 family protein
MLYIDSLYWDDWNEEHIARHGVDPDQVEEVIFDNEYFSSRARNGTYRLIGRANSGRYLVVFLAPRDGGIFYVVTARDATDNERRLYTQHVR